VISGTALDVEAPVHRGRRGHNAKENRSRTLVVMSTANAARHFSEHLAGVVFLAERAVACQLRGDDSNTSLAAGGALAQAGPSVGLRFCRHA
jgi:hypothetical protein